MSFISRATAITSEENIQQLYDDWATTYDQDMLDSTQDYVAPALAAQAVLQSLDATSIPTGIKILDAGCGTGFVGTYLAKAGAQHVDGLDLSPGMLAVARKTGAYKSLEVADLSKPIKIEDGQYDVVTCVGTLTQGHVGSEVLAEFVRVAKKGGVIVATIRETVWTDLGFDVEVKRLESEGIVDILGNELQDYRRGADAKAFMLRLKKT